ncbi:hypothetical protein [[Eubacterium] cellulosolvens]
MGLKIQKIFYNKRNLIIMMEKRYILIGVIILLFILIIGINYPFKETDQKQPQNEDQTEKDIEESIDEQIQIECLSREEINRMASLLQINDSEEFFGNIFNYSDAIGGLVYVVNPPTNGFFLPVEKLVYPHGTILKIKGKYNPDNWQNEFNIETIEPITINSSVIDLCRNSVINYSGNLSKINFTKLCNRTGVEIYFNQTDIINSTNKTITPLIDSKGQLLHFIYEGIRVSEGIAVHYPYVDCIYNMDKNRIEKFLVYVYGHAEE